MNEFKRGDTFAFKTPIKFADGSPVTYGDIDTLFVTCKARPTNTSPILFQKSIDDINIDEEGYCHVVFKPEDTETLEYGKYFFDIEVTLRNGYRKTALHSFVLKEETTTHGGDANGS